ncbi:hypothetical protein JCM3770_005813, partial [Rhodotorula araucariae]
MPTPAEDDSPPAAPHARLPRAAAIAAAAGPSSSPLHARPAGLPTDSHLRGPENYDVWRIQMRGLIGPDAYRVMTGELTRAAPAPFSPAEWDRLNDFAISSLVISVAPSVIHHVQDVDVDAHTYWCTLREAFRPTDAQGALRLLTRFWGLSLPTASPEALEAFAKEYRSTLAALKVAHVDLDMIYSSHLLNALPSSLASLQTSIAVANQATLPTPDVILDLVRNEVLRAAPAGGSVALAAGA